MSTSAARRRAVVPAVVVPLAVSAGLAVVTGPPAHAAPPQTLTFLDAGVSCSGTTAAGEPVAVSAYSSADFGSGAYVRVGAGEEPLLEAISTSARWEAGRFGFELMVFDEPEGPQTGTGSLSGTTTETSTTSTTEHGGTGNQRVRVDRAQAVLAGVATVELPGHDVGALDCSGTSTTTTVTTNQPASTVRFDRQLFDNARCTTDAVVGLFTAEGETYLDVSGEHDGRQYSLFGVVDASRDRFEAVLPLRDGDTGEHLADVPVAVALTPSGPTVVNELRTSIARVVARRTWYDVTATAELPWGTVTATCRVLEVETREIVTAAQGPQPGGRPPVNDTPDGAVPLAVGDVARTTNRGAATEPEAELWCEGLPARRTVWYSVEGTGGTVRLDTAGSDIDTVLGVYEAGADGGLVQVACGDDVESELPGLPADSLQAVVEVPTEAGTTYLVQVGGALGDVGRVVLSAERR